VKILIGPSSAGATIDGGQSRRIGPGDVIIVLPGVAHWFSAIESDLDYWCPALIPHTCCPRDTCIPC
jgi:mannose-6-phosphate isomerase-like protein (cupin superfamily)